MINITAHHLASQQKLHSQNTSSIDTIHYIAKCILSTPAVNKPRIITGRLHPTVYNVSVLHS